MPGRPGLGGLSARQRSPAADDRAGGAAREQRRGLYLLSPCPAQRRVDLGLERGRVYEIAVFQAERRTVHSHYRLTLANFSGPRSRCQNVCGDGIVTAEEACDLGGERATRIAREATHMAVHGDEPGCPSGKVH